MVPTSVIRFVELSDWGAGAQDSELCLHRFFLKRVCLGWLGFGPDSRAWLVGDGVLIGFLAALVAEEFGIGIPLDLGLP